MESKNTIRRVWIYPGMDCDCGCTEGEEDFYHLTYELPGVKKEDINLRVTKEALRLIGKRSDIEYVNEFNFCCDADVDNVKSSYENGILNVEIPFSCPNPFKDAKSVKIE